MVAVVNQSIASDCTGWSAWSDWDTCDDDEQSRTRTRSCASGATSLLTESQDCSSSSGGSSWSSSIPYVTPDPKASFVVSAQPGEPKVLTVSNEKISVKRIIIQVNEETKNLNLKVTQLSGKPDVPAASRKVVDYLEIDVAEIDIDQATIIFEVKNQWLIDNGVSASEIVLQRYHNGWIVLPTRHLSSGTVHMFEATTPGFSYFAISVTEPVASVDSSSQTVTEPAEQEVVEQESDEVTTEPVVTDTTAPADEPVDEKGSSGAFWWIILVVLVLVGVWFFLFRRRE